MGSPFSFVIRDHFRSDLTRKEAIGLFRHSIKMVEIEPFSYCNRTCWFCPNSFIDRRTSCEFMPMSLFDSILKQLAEIEYTGMISLGRYNEPMSQAEIIDYVECAARNCPNAVMHFNTNGDYLTRRFVDQLYAKGLKSLNIQMYFNKTDLINVSTVRERLKRVSNTLGLEPKTVFEKTKRGHYLYQFDYKGLNLRSQAKMFERNGCDRGGTLEINSQSPRTSPCLSPFWHIYVDYNGKVMPCCNLRSDISEHIPYIVADLNESPDIFEAYTNQTAVNWRRKLAVISPKEAPCSTCSFVTYNPADIADDMDRIELYLHPPDESDS
nr:radical SAM protein [uncultured Desulfobacter sp.]